MFFSSRIDPGESLTRKEQLVILARLDARIAEMEAENERMWRAYEWYLPRDVDDAAELPQAS